jgi:hypothetical protein
VVPSWFSFMTLAEIRQGALDASWGPRKRDLLEAYLADFSVLPLGHLIVLGLDRSPE